MRLAGRTPRELAFRLNQAIANLKIWTFPPALADNTEASGIPLPGSLVVAAALKGSQFELEILKLAGQIAEHRFPLFGRAIETGPEIDWRCDYINVKTSGLAYFKFIPYLDFHQLGDHKNIWELNRHQHLITLAQAYLFDGNPAWIAEIRSQLGSWRIQNPFLKGINWCSALEVAFRALSWLWIDHLVGPITGLPRGLYEHATYLEHNLSTYFSPNTHLLGEAVALHAIGLKLNVEKWRALGARIVDEQLERQVQTDGSHFEQSTYYHVYALDFFLLHYILAGKPDVYRVKLRKMAQFLSTIMGPARLLTCFGDDDGGRLFHPYGERDRFGRATLATCAVLFPDDVFPFDTADFAVQAAWWVGVMSAVPIAARAEACHFADSGLTVMAAGDVHIIIDAGPFGAGSAGHSHSDTLSVTARIGEREMLIDPATYTYVADTKLRDAFRGTGFHNTIRIDGLDQADAANPFQWENKPEVHVYDSQPGFLDAACRYRGFTHRRRVLAIWDELLLILDEVTGPPGLHLIEQSWHLGDENVPIIFSDPSAVRREAGLRSRAFGQKEAAVAMRGSWRKVLPHMCAVAIYFAPFEGTLEQHGLELSIGGKTSVSFASPGMPVVIQH